MMPDRALRFSLVSVALGLRPLLWLFAGGPANFQASPLPPTSGMLAGLLAGWLGWAGWAGLGWAVFTLRLAPWIAHRALERALRLALGSRIALIARCAPDCAWIAPLAQIAPGLRLERATPSFACSLVSEPGNSVRGHIFL